MPQLGRFDYTVQDPSGNAISGASVAVYREGATVNGNQSGTSPLAVTVRHAGKIATGDSVFINAATGTTYSATRTSSTVITLAGFGGTLALTGGDRLTPSNNQPTLYGDDQGGATTSNPLTSDSTGRVSCWAESRICDLVVSGTGVTTRAFVSQSIIDYYKLEFNAKAFGAKGDDSTDDATAIQAALTEAAETTSSGIGGIVYLPRGTFRLGSQITIPNKVRLTGVARSASVLKANAGIAPATGLVRLGDGTGTVFGTRLENLTVDCNNVAASIGVYSTEANEQSGVRDCVVTGFRTNGIKFSGASVQHAFIEGSEVYGSASGATSGIYLTGTGGIIYLNRLTVNGNIASPMTHSIHNEDDVAAWGIHGEYATNLLFFDTGAVGTAVNIFGHSSITSCVNIAAGASNGIFVAGVYTNGATNSVLDSRSSRTLTSTNLGLYVVGDGAGAAAQVITSVGALAAGHWTINSPVARTVQTFAGGDTTPSVALGEVFKTNNVGPINITMFDDGVAGQVIRVIVDANTTIVDGGNLLLAGNLVGTTNDTMTLVFDGTNWFELARSVN